MTGLEMDEGVVVGIARPNGKDYANITVSATRDKDDPHNYGANEAVIRVREFSAQGVHIRENDSIRWTQKEASWTSGKCLGKVNIALPRLPMPKPPESLR